MPPGCQYSDAQYTEVTAGSIRFILPEAIRTKKMNAFALFQPRVGSSYPGTRIYNILANRQLLPEAETNNAPLNIYFPTTIEFAQAQAGIDARNPAWVKGFYYPFYTTRQPIPDTDQLDAVSVYIVNTSNGSIVASRVGADTTPVILPTAGTYRFEYVVNYQGFTSAKVNRNLTVKQAP